MVAMHSAQVRESQARRLHEEDYLALLPADPFVTKSSEANTLSFLQGHSTLQLCLQLGMVLEQLGLCVVEDSFRRWFQG